MRPLCETGRLESTLITMHYLADSNNFEVEKKTWENIRNFLKSIFIEIKIKMNVDNNNFVQ